MRLHWLLPTIKGIPVLMYHRVSRHLADGLTVTTAQLEQQMRYLKEEGYEALDMESFLRLALQMDKDDNEKKALITFDDGYQSQYKYAYPLLKKMGFKASFFIIGDSLDGNIDAGDELNRKMTIGELKALDKDIIQLGMHGYHHENFKNTPVEEIEKIILRSKAVFKNHNIPLTATLAYPYGARATDPTQAAGLRDVFHKTGVTAAFRIGNRVCGIPPRNMFDIFRIDIRGTDSFEDFKIKLRKGKLKPF